MVYYKASLERNISVLIGKTFATVEREDEQIRFVGTDGSVFVLAHSEDCCESVYVEDVCGDLSDLTGAPITMTEEASNSDDPIPQMHDWQPESYTWTFFRIGTAKGSVTIRFFGESNGFYSESASLYELEGPCQS